MENKGHLFLAQNSDVNYVEQAYALALSIKKHNKIYNRTCLLTNNQVPKKYLHAFDYVIPLPGEDLAISSEWKVHNRYKMIYESPFKENIVYDADMILTESNDHWWKYFQGKDLFFTSNVTDYKGNIINNDFYRKTFTANDLPNIYVGVFYFKKTDVSYEFFRWLEIITKNWEEFFKTYLKNKPPRFYSMDVGAALAIKIMDCELEVSNKSLMIPSFVHMKPALQGWSEIPDKWTNKVPYYLDQKGKLKVGSFIQPTVFHYVEEEFLTDAIISKLEN
jgi:hypothetical protein